MSGFLDVYKEIWDEKDRFAFSTLVTCLISYKNQK